MRKLVLVIFICTLSNSALAQSGGFVQFYTAADSFGLAVNGGVSTDFNENWGLSTFLLVGNQWGEAYIGPTYSPAEWIEFCVSAGVQQGEGETTEPRYSLSVFTGFGTFSAFSVFEFDHSGTDGVWYDTTPRFALLEWLNVGVKLRRFVGLGPYVSVSGGPLGLPVSIWGSWNPYEVEESEVDLQSGLIGLTVGF